VKHRIRLLAASVIVAGAALLARPAPARATYVNPLEPPGGSDDEMFCCRSSGVVCCGRHVCTIYQYGCSAK
jgi:hypothetical protein